jgi:hypothetical protein
LIEDSLALFSIPWQPSWHEVEEHDLLVMILSIVKAAGNSQSFTIHLEEFMQRFEPQIPKLNLQDPSIYAPESAELPRTVSISSNGELNS